MKKYLALVLVLALALSLSAAAFADGKVLTRADVNYVKQDAPAAAAENGVVTEAEWAAVYPEIVASYEANADNSYTVEYLDEDPYLRNIYEGFGFAKMYLSAKGHTYCLEDIGDTARPHPLANCLTCKTADFTALVNSLGAEAYSLSYDEVYPAMSSSVGCYNCHENSAGDLVVTHDYINTTLASDLDKIDKDVLACGQCHIEYYFRPEDKGTDIPYTSIDNMGPDDMLAFYDAIGFADWTQESTGAKLLKVQHPEMETYLGKGSMHAIGGITCADCHMPVEAAEDGSAYISHKLVSPLESESILQGVCASCHAGEDMAAKVHAIQDQVTARETEIGNALSEYKDAVAAANASGDYSEEELEQLRGALRSAQWYFDFCYVENSEGAHNSALANECLDKAAEIIEAAQAYFKA